MAFKIEISRVIQIRVGEIHRYRALSAGSQYLILFIEDEDVAFIKDFHVLNGA
ncbi:hypothetical protein D3C71_1977480 [compost metagenome]